MNYPLISEYIDAILNAEDNFATLTNLRPVLTGDGRPVMSSGNFAVVFKMKDIATEKEYAVKCFVKDHYKGKVTVLKKRNSNQQDEREDTYGKITEYLNHTDSKYLISIKYLTEELFVDTNMADGNDYPVLLMDWVDGITLDKYIQKYIDDPYELAVLSWRFCKLASFLFNSNFAHGDLKPDNILVKENGELVLVDYDGMYVPSMKGTESIEIGSPLYRHPLRTNEDFNENIDDFALAIISLSLKCIAINPTLFKTRKNQDTLLFSENDYNNIANSIFLKVLSQFPGDQDLLCKCSNLLWVLTHKDFRSIQKDPFITNYFIEPDNNSCVYSPDGLILLSTTKSTKRRSFSVKPGTKEIHKKAYIAGDIIEFTIPESLEVIPRGILGGYKMTIVNKSRFFNIEGDILLDNNGRFIAYLNMADYLGEIPADIYMDRGVVYSSDRKKLLLYPHSLPYTEYEIIDGCEEISTGAFSFVVNPDDETGAIDIIGNHIIVLSIPPSVKRFQTLSLQGCTETCIIRTPVGNMERLSSLLREYTDCQIYYSNLSEIILPTNEITIATKEEKDNSICDNYGVKYSPDFKKLIDAPQDISGHYDIPQGVEIICDNAFSGTGIKYLVLPNTVKYIGNSVFYYSELEHIVLSKNLIYIGDDAFSISCLKEIIFPEGLVWIGNSAFDCCELSHVALPSTVKFIGEASFAWFSDFGGYGPLKSISLNEGLGFIGNYAFDRQSLKTITIPSSVKHIGKNPFDHSLIREVHSDNYRFKVENEVLYYGWPNYTLISSFSKQNVLKVKDRTIRIGESAFESNEFIEQIIIPSSVRSIDDCAFQSCHNLTHIQFSEGLREIGECAFNACSSLIDCQLPNSLEIIRRYAFSGCNSIRRVNVPYNLKLVEENPWNDDKVTFIEQQSKNFVVIDNSLYDASSKTLVSSNPYSEYVKIIDKTKIIGKWAFYNAENIKTVNLPNSLCEIQDCAFWGCKKLEYLILPASIIKLGDSSVFEFCKNLKKIYVYKDSYAYDAMVKSIYTKTKVEIITHTTNYLFYRDLPSDENYTTYSQDGTMLVSACKDIAINEGTIGICDDCFDDLYSEIDNNYVSKIVIPQSLKYIGKNCFCGWISEIISHSPNFIVENSCLLSTDRTVLYYYFGEKDSFVVPTTVDYIEAGAFKRRNLKYIEISENVRHMGFNPFVDNLSEHSIIVCKSPYFEITNNMLIEKSSGRLIGYWGTEINVILPNNIKQIDRNAFFASRIQIIELADSIELIDEYALMWCFDLKKIIVPKGKKYKFEHLIPVYQKSLIEETV